MNDPLTFLTVCSALYIGLYLFARYCSRPMIFPAPSPNYKADEKPFITIPGPNDLPMHAVHLNNTDSKFTILYSHGNAEDIGSLYPFVLKLYAEKGYNLFAYDYPGYGHTPGTPSEENAYAAIDKAYDYLVNTANIAPENILLYGRSLGGGPSVDLACRTECAGLILEATFKSIIRVVTKIKILPYDVFDNIAKISRIKCPLLSIHGTDDIVVPFSHGKALYEAAPEPKQYHWEDGGGHNDLIYLMEHRYWEKIDGFTKGLNNN